MPKAHRYAHAARNFMDAYANTNYLRPLRGKDLERFYVDRGVHSELRNLLGQLEVGVSTSPPNNTKFLFVGHTGCGKSTELSRLVSLIEGGEAENAFLRDSFLPVQYSISEVVGLYNIEFVDIALSMVVGLYRAIEALSLTLDDKPARLVYDWIYKEAETTESKARQVGGGLDAELGIPGLIKLIDVRLKGEGEVREEIRTRIRKYLPELISLINNVIDEVSELTGKSILLIIDDLDKIQPLENALKVFREHSRSLASFKCFVIYTAPISLLYDPASKHVDQYMHVHYMPMFSTQSRDGKGLMPDGEDVGILREIIHKRVHPTLFEDGVVDTSIGMTGGVLRELIRVIQGCCVYCHEFEFGTITQNVLERQKGKLKGEYYRMLDHEDYRALRKVDVTKSRADVNMRHLESLCVLYYPNGKGWFDVHPIVKELLHEWESEALPDDVEDEHVDDIEARTKEEG